MYPLIRVISTQNGVKHHFPHSMWKAFQNASFFVKILPVAKYVLWSHTSINCVYYLDRSKIASDLANICCGSKSSILPSRLLVVCICYWSDCVCVWFGWHSSCWLASNSAAAAAGGSSCRILMQKAACSFEWKAFTLHFSWKCELPHIRHLATCSTCMTNMLVPHIPVDLSLCG